jgi:hypothetical protein
MNGNNATVGLGLFLLAVAAFMAFASRRQLRTSQLNAKLQAESANWPSAPGQITDVRIDVTRGVVSTGNSITPTQSYQPKVAYLYAVGGRQYRGARINFKVLNFTFENRAKKSIKNYKVGAAVPVFYDPADPQVSVLDRDSKPRAVDISTMFFFVLSVVVGLLGVGMFFIPL